MTVSKGNTNMTYRSFNGQEGFNDWTVRYDVLGPSFTQVVKGRCAAGQQCTTTVYNVRQTD